MPYYAITYTAIWVCEYGIIGGGDDPVRLTIANIPAITATGQSPSGYHNAGSVVELEPGVAPSGTGLTFAGWIRGNVLPNVGDSFADWQTQNPLVTVQQPGVTHYSFVMPYYEITYTAIWVRHGYVAPSLIVNNLPAFADRPIGQTPSQYVAGGGSVVLEAGTVPGLNFLGWVRGEVLPTSGTTFEAFRLANPGIVFNAGHTANVPQAGYVRYTAIWGYNGYVAPNLIVNNLPTDVSRPAGQTETQYIPGGDNSKTLVEGTAPAGFVFRGWVRGANLPAIGSDINDFTGTLYPAGFTTVVPAAGAVTYTAIWTPPCGTVVGNYYRLTVRNFPTTAAPDGQTATGYRRAGTVLNLVSGNRANRQFLGWARGDGYSNLSAANGMTWNAAVSAGHIVVVLPNDRMPSHNITVYAIWGYNNVIGRTPDTGGGGGGGGGAWFPPAAPPTTLPAPRPPVEPEPIVDVQEEQFHARFMVGFPDGSFRPYNYLTRAEATALLVRTMTTQFGVGVLRPGVDIVDRFSDVEPGVWYFNYLAVAYRYGLINGFPDGTFRPDQPITREEFAGIVARTTTVLTGGMLPYTDARNVSYWAHDYVYTMYRLGWMHGDVIGTFRPLDNVRRNEVTALLSRALGRGDTNARSLENVWLQLRTFTDVTNVNTWYYFYVVEATNGHWFVMDGDTEIWTRVDNQTIQ